MAETDYVKLAIKIAGKVFKVIKKEILKGSLKFGP